MTAFVLGHRAAGVGAWLFYATPAPAVGAGGIWSTALDEAVRYASRERARAAAPDGSIRFWTLKLVACQACAVTLAAVQAVGGQCRACEAALRPYRERPVVRWTDTGQTTLTVDDEKGAA